MAELFAAAERAGAAGSKACGEGGGGFLLFVCREGRRTMVEDSLRERGGNLMDVRFIPSLRL
jgi:D-glycero-alpha-D-manno-heptose-7-phosphate kinase